MYFIPTWGEIVKGRREHESGNEIRKTKREKGRKEAEKRKEGG